MCLNVLSLIHLLNFLFHSSTKLFSRYINLSFCLCSNAFWMGFASTDPLLKAAFRAPLLDSSWYKQRQVWLESAGDVHHLSGKDPASVLTSCTFPATNINTLGTCDGDNDIRYPKFFIIQKDTNNNWYALCWLYFVRVCLLLPYCSQAGGLTASSFLCQS